MDLERQPYSFDEEAQTDFNPLQDFDPLQDFAFSATNADDAGDDVIESTLEEGPYNLPNPDAAPQYLSQLVSFTNGATRDERIEALFAQMPTLEKMLFNILDTCKEPVATQDLEAHIAKLKEHHHAIYTPATLCTLLEQAGALDKCTEDGTSLADYVQEPLKVIIDGAEYWEVAPAPVIYWMLTPEGLAQLETYKPLERIDQCYTQEPQYAQIFTTVLELCARVGGSSIKQIGDVVDDEPIMQNPKRYAMYFIDKLEHAGAVEWQGSWIATAPGQEYLQKLTKDGE